MRSGTGGKVSRNKAVQFRRVGTRRAGRRGRRPLRIRNNGCEKACRIPRREGGVNPSCRCTQGGSQWASTPTNTQQRLRKSMPDSTQGGWCESVASVHARRVAVGVDPYEYATTVAKKHAEFHAGTGGASIRCAASRRAGRRGRRPLRIRNNGCEKACRIPRREGGGISSYRCTRGGSPWASTPTNTQ